MADCMMPDNPPPPVGVVTVGGTEDDVEDEAFVDDEDEFVLSLG